MKLMSRMTRRVRGVLPSCLLGCGGALRVVRIVVIVCLCSWVFVGGVGKLNVKGIDGVQEV